MSSRREKELGKFGKTVLNSNTIRNNARSAEGRQKLFAFYIFYDDIKYVYASPIICNIFGRHISGLVDVFLECCHSFSLFGYLHETL